MDTRYSYMGVDAVTGLECYLDTEVASQWDHYRAVCPHCGDTRWTSLGAAPGDHTILWAMRHGDRCSQRPKDR